MKLRLTRQIDKDRVRRTSLDQVLESTILADPDDNVILTLPEAGTYYIRLDVAEEEIGERGVTVLVMMNPSLVPRR